MVYIFIIVLLFLLSCRYDLNPYRNQKDAQWLPFIFIIIILVAGLRDELGADTINYLNFFNSTPTISTINESYYDSSRFRPGFINILSLCKSIIPNFIFFQFVESIFINSIVFIFIYRYSKTPYLCILLYVIINYLEFNMEIMREAISVGLVMSSWMCWKRGKKVSALSFFLIATTVHISSFIALIYPLVDKIRFDRKWIIAAIIAIICIPLIYFSIPNLDFYVSILLKSDSESVIGIYTSQQFSDKLTINAYLIHIIQFVFVGIGLYILKKNGEPLPYAGYILVYMIVMYLSTITYGFYRIGNYFSLFYILFLAKTISLLCKKTVLARALMPIFFIVALCYLTYYHQVHLLSPEEYSTRYVYERYIPYKSVLE